MTDLYGPGMLLCLLVLVTATMASTAEYRLPTTVAPEHYWVMLRPAFETEDFLTTGNVRVLVSCRTSTDLLVFSLNGIDVDQASVSVSAYSGRQLDILKQASDNETQMYTLTLGSSLVPGEKYYMEMNFSYKLNEDLEGFYRSSYIDSEGKTRWLATTQFSPINARRAFPCWDEPSFKAVFNITLGRHKDMSSISNMPTFLTTQMKDRPDWVWDHHGTTLPVSTYLVAFVVTDLPSRDLTDTSHPHFKVWSRQELLHEMNYMGEISPKILSFIAEYFKTPFPLQKIDLFAVPDFGFSAMENWGLITFSESSLKATKTIAHELAHQWFGNLVTPAWWEDLWLKEGFATFIGVTALDGVEGNSNATDKWIVDELQHSMFLDSLLGSHPVSNPVDDPRKIWQAFDVISYEKGSSIIRMMCEFLGEDTFREGLNIYLRKFAFGNARREQLWESFRELSNTEVATVMDLWTLQSGYPVLNVSRDYATGAIAISQERFLLRGSHDEKTLWHIPYSYTFKSDKDMNHNYSWLSKPEDTLLSSQIPKNDWLLLNLKRSGYYRVNYDSNNWALLIEDFWKLPRLSQVQLINDAFNLAIPGRVEYDVPFRLADQLIESNDNFIWNTTIAEFTTLSQLLVGTDLLQELKEYALTLFQSQKLTYDSDEKVLVNFASTLDEMNLIKESIEGIQAMIKGKNPSYPKEVRASFYCSAVRNSGQEVWDFLWERYLKEKDPEEKSNFIAGLTCTKQVSNLNRLLDGLLSDDSGIRKQEAKTVFPLIAVNEAGVDLALDFLIQNWDRIKQRFGLGYKIMSTMVSSFGSVLNQQTQLDKVKKLYNDLSDDLGSTSNAFLYTLERAEININWIKNHYETVQNIVKNKTR